MRQRGFTLIELVIVLSLILILLVPLGTLVIQGYQSFTALSMQASSKAECQRAAESVFHLVARQPNYRIDKDHHGLRFADGSWVHFQNQRLELTQRGRTRVLLAGLVSDFTVIRHSKILTLNIAVLTKMHAHGQSQGLHEIYDYPRVGLP